jgi:hypothetical protein
MLYPQLNEDAAGEAYCKSSNIDRRKSFVADQVAPGDFDVVFKHGEGSYVLRGANSMPQS